MRKQADHEGATRQYDKGQRRCGKQIRSSRNACAAGPLDGAWSAGGRQDSLYGRKFGRQDRGELGTRGQGDKVVTL